MPRQTLQKLTLFLLKEDASAQDALRDLDRLTSYRVAAIDPAEDSLFTRARRPTSPQWVAYLDEHVDGRLEGMLTASASAVLLIAVQDRLLAATWGQGRFLIDPEMVVPDFGLRVVLNTVAPDRIKSVDARTIDETTMHTRRDLSRDSSLQAFGLDVSRDLLRAVTGSPRDETLAHRVTGSEALGIHVRAQVPDLPALAERLLEAYEATDYRENFEFIDHLALEKSLARLQQLDETLIADLQAREITDAHLAAPEPLDWLELRGFRFSFARDGEPVNDPSISAYLDARADRTVDRDLLKRDQLVAVRATDGEPMAKWSIYRSLVYQVELEERLYVLSAGQWFRVDRDYRERVEREVRALPLRDGLPDADPGTDEAAYNAKAARALGAACLDGRLVFDGGPDKMEVCDILTRERNLIHVKHRGSSSTLSHLFAQGVGSAERLLLDREFRQAARQVAAAVNASFQDAIPLERPDPGAWEITFAVITRSTRETPLTLPFFSVVSLRTAARHLDGYGFKVSVAAVNER